MDFHSGIYSIELHPKFLRVLSEAGEAVVDKWRGQRVNAELRA